MLLTVHRPHLSITDQITDGEIADFVVMFGVNGSGKSHLLQSIANGGTLVDGASLDSSNAKMYGLNQLIPTPGESQNPAYFRDAWGRLKPIIDAIAQQFGFPSPDTDIDSHADLYAERLAQSLAMPPDSLRKIQNSAGKVIARFTPEDFRRYFPLYNMVNDLFTFSITDVFLTYSERLRENRFNKFLNQSEGETVEWLRAEEFEERYGKPPWTMLNEVLRVMDLPYRFKIPINLPADLPYQAMLINPEADNRELHVGELSTGEQVLLALALGLYAGQHLGDSITRPQILLLDETDASLHPSMARSLLTVTKEILHERHGVKVILATHSATTVALAPTGSLYLMSKSGSPRLRRVDRDFALSSLTIGLPTLSVRTDQRRQVLVESQQDEECYTNLYSILREDIGSPFSLQFLASGAGGAGNRYAVEELVTNLRSKGNDLVYGIVDRDSNAVTPPYVLLSTERYSIENFLLDPLVLGAFLLRCRIMQPEKIGLDAPAYHFNLGKENAQSIVDYVATCLDLDHEPSSPVFYHGKFEARIPKYFLECQGHAIEENVRSKYPQLHPGRNILREISSTVLAEAPQLVPWEITNLLSRLARVEEGAPGNSTI